MDETPTAFYDSVVGEPGAAAVVDARSHRSPSAVPLRRRRRTGAVAVDVARPRRRRSQVDDFADSGVNQSPQVALLVPLPLCAAAGHVAAYVCAVFFSFSCPTTVWGPLCSLT